MTIKVNQDVKAVDFINTLNKASAIASHYGFKTEIIQETICIRGDSANAVFECVEDFLSYMCGWNAANGFLFKLEGGPAEGFVGA